MPCVYKNCLFLHTIFLYYYTYVIISGVRKEKFRGFKVMAGLVGGPGAKPPGRQRIFENLQKCLSRKLQKCIILAYFSKTSTNLALIFRAFGRQPHFWEILRIFWKYLMKIQKLNKNSNRKIEFLYILGKVVANNRPFGNMYHQFSTTFFRFGGFEPPNPSCVRHW